MSYNEGYAAHYRMSIGIPRTRNGANRELRVK